MSNTLSHYLLSNGSFDADSVYWYSTLKSFKMGKGRAYDFTVPHSANKWCPLLKFPVGEEWCIDSL